MTAQPNIAMYRLLATVRTYWQLVKWTTVSTQCTLVATILMSIVI